MILVYNNINIKNQRLGVKLRNKFFKKTRSMPDLCMIFDWLLVDSRQDRCTQSYRGC